MDDLISRQAAIREYQEVCKGIKCGECPLLIKVNTEKGSHLITDCKLEAFLHDLPYAQPDIKQAAKLLSDFIESCPGGDSYLITPDGEELRTDWGYATEGIKLIHDWAERKNDG